MLVEKSILNWPFEEPTPYWAYEQGQEVIKILYCQPALFKEIKLPPRKPPFS